MTYRVTLELDDKSMADCLQSDFTPEELEDNVTTARLCILRDYGNVVSMDYVEETAVHSDDTSRGSS